MIRLILWEGVASGNDPATSVTNSYGQTHDIPNLFVVGGAASIRYIWWGNPTNTVMALAARSANFIIDQLKKREIQ